MKAAALFAYALICVTVVTAFAGDSNEPPVPPGTDPGGVAVAIIETGVDYTLPLIAERLARDGEGEIIGWDFNDNDRQPYKIKDDLEDMDYSHRGTAMTRIVLKRAPRARIEPVSIATDDDRSVRRALAFVSQTPAKVAVLALKLSTASLWAAVRDEMQRAPQQFLLVVAAGEDEGDKDRIKEHLAPSLTGLDNVIVVTACDHNGHVLTTADNAATNADIAVNTEAFSAELLSAGTFSFKPEASVGAAEIGAMAVRLLSKDEDLKPSELKAAILSQAKPLAAGSTNLARSGYIAEPWRHFSGQ